MVPRVYLYTLLCTCIVSLVLNELTLLGNPFLKLNSSPSSLFYHEISQQMPVNLRVLQEFTAGGSLSNVSYYSPFMLHDNRVVFLSNATMRKHCIPRIIYISEHSRCVPRDMYNAIKVQEDHFYSFSIFQIMSLQLIDCHVMWISPNSQIYKILCLV